MDDQNIQLRKYILYYSLRIWSSYGSGQITKDRNASYEIERKSAV